MAMKKGNAKPFQISTDPNHFIEVAEKHLARVKGALSPLDWSDLGTYGLYCLEALVRAASLKAGETPIRTHWGKADQARNLHQKNGLPDIEDVLNEMNVIRKAIAYGDSEFEESDHDANSIVKSIEDYFDKVSKFCT